MYGYPGAYPPPQQGAYPPPGGAYPPPQQGAYPPPGGAYPPPQQGGYQMPSPVGGYPAQQQGAYPPPQQGAYPPPGGAYPPPGGAYPPSQQGAYPPPGGAYPPPQQGAYPPPGGAYPPPQQGAYPPPGGAYPPPQQGAYPPPGGAYPPKGPYEQQSFSYSPTGYPPQQMGQDRHVSVQAYPAQAYPAQGMPSGAPANVLNLNQPVTTTTPLLSPAECDEAAKNLRDAMKGFGTDEKKLISVLGKYPPIQMNQIIKSYKSNFGKNLIDAVKSETSGNFGKLCCALCMTIIEFDVKCLHDVSNMTLIKKKKKE